MSIDQAKFKETIDQIGKKLMGADISQKELLELQLKIDVLEKWASLVGSDDVDNDGGGGIGHPHEHHHHAAAFLQRGLQVEGTTKVG